MDKVKKQTWLGFINYWIMTSIGLVLCKRLDDDGSIHWEIHKFSTYLKMCEGQPPDKD